MGNKQTIKKKQNKHFFSSKERKAYYMGLGFGLSELSIDSCPGIKKVMSSMSIDEDISFTNGILHGDDYLLKNKIKRKQIYK